MFLSTTGVGTYTNYTDGNVLSGNRRVSAWDSQNRLVSRIGRSGALVKRRAALGGPVGRKPSPLPGGMTPA